MEALMLTKEEEALQCRMAVEARLQEMGVEVLGGWENCEKERYTVVFKLDEQFALYYSTMYWEEDLDLGYILDGPGWGLLDNEVAVRDFDRIMDPDLPKIDRPVKYKGTLQELIKLKQKIA